MNDKKDKGGPPAWIALIVLAVGAGGAFFLLNGGGESLPAPPNVAAPPAESETTESGLATMVLQEGTGHAHPLANTRVLVHYTGWTTDGEMFDSSVVRGEPIELPLDGVIAGWQEGVQLMVEGEKRRMWIPEPLAYGGRDGAPQGMLVFDVELIRILR